jgi:hypothetical protein
MHLGDKTKCTSFKADKSNILKKLSMQNCWSKEKCKILVLILIILVQSYQTSDNP